MPLKLKPVKMKNSLYLLVPKGISELLELDANSECVLTTEKEGQNPILRYAFKAGRGVLHEADKSGPGRKHHPNSLKALEAEAE